MHKHHSTRMRVVVAAPGSKLIELCCKQVRLLSALCVVGDIGCISLRLS